MVLIRVTSQRTYQMYSLHLSRFSAFKTCLNKHDFMVQAFFPAQYQLRKYCFSLFRVESLYRVFIIIWRVVTWFTWVQKNPCNAIAMLCHYYCNQENLCMVSWAIRWLKNAFCGLHRSIITYVNWFFMCVNDLVVDKRRDLYFFSKLECQT